MQREIRRRWPPRRVLDETTRPELLGDEAVAAAPGPAAKGVSQ